MLSRSPRLNVITTSKFFGKVCGMKNDRNDNGQRRNRGTRRRVVDLCEFCVFCVDRRVCRAGRSPAAGAQPADRSRRPSSAAGELLVQQCGFCHGANARGGSGGPDLTRSALVQTDENGQAARRVPPGRPARSRDAEVRPERRAERRPRRVPARRDLSQFEPPPLQDPRHPRRRSQGGRRRTSPARAAAARATRRTATSRASARSTSRRRCRGGC